MMSRSWLQWALDLLMHASDEEMGKESLVRSSVPLSPRELQEQGTPELAETWPNDLGVSSA